MTLKKQFLNYLKSYYGAESTMMDSGLPPMRQSPRSFPAFQKESEALSMLGQQFGGGGMGGPMQGMGAMQGGMPQNPGPRRLGGPREDAQGAQDVLLGR